MGVERKKRLGMEIRRRNIGGTADAGVEEPGSISSFEDGEEAYREGLELYSRAQQSSFQDTDVLTKSIKRIITASEKGVDDASVWMKSFLDSPSVDLPSQLVREMQVMTDATPTEKQVRLAAKSMFQKMAAGRETIPGKEISKKAKGLLEIEDTVHLKKSSKMLEGSINRLMHDALVINQKDEVYMYKCNIQLLSDFPGGTCPKTPPPPTHVLRACCHEYAIVSSL